MSSVYPGNPATPTPFAAPSITIPADTDPATAASVNAAFQKLADEVAYLKTKLALGFSAANAGGFAATGDASHPGGAFVGGASGATAGLTASGNNGVTGAAGGILSNGVGSGANLLTATALAMADGPLQFTNLAPNVARTAALRNALTAANIVKAWGILSSASLVLSYGDCFNVSSASVAASGFTINFAQPFAGASYVPLCFSNNVNLGGATNVVWQPALVSASQLTFTPIQANGATSNLTSVSLTIFFAVLGFQ